MNETSPCLSVFHPPLRKFVLSVFGGLGICSVKYFHQSDANEKEVVGAGVGVAVAIVSVVLGIILESTKVKPLRKCMNKDWQDEI